MRIYRRLDTPAVAFASADFGEDPRFAFMLASTPINFGWVTSPYHRWRRRAEDQNYMTRGFLLSREGDRVLIRGATRDFMLMCENAEFAAKIFARAGFKVGAAAPFAGSLEGAMRDAASRSPLSLTIYDPQAHKIFGDTRLMRAVEVLNDKLLAGEYLARQGVPMPRSRAFRVGPGQGRVRRTLRRFGVPCYVKRRQGAGGFGNIRIDSVDDGIGGFRWLIGQTVLFQEYLDRESSLGVVYNISRDSVEQLLQSRQRIQDSVYYVGSDWNRDLDGAVGTEGAAEACRRLGYVGLLGFDMKGLICDVNPRLSASVMLRTVLDRVPDVSRLSLLCYIPQPADRLADCGLHSLWYKDGRGVLPTEWNKRGGWLSLILVNDHTGEVEEELSNRLGQGRAGSRSRGFAGNPGDASRAPGQ